MSSKVWLKQYPQGMPAEINPNEYSSVVDLFEQSCEKFSTKSVLNNLGSTLTYQQLDNYTKLFAAYLQQTLQLKVGDRVAIMLPNVFQYFVAIFGSLRAGMTVVNVNPLYTPRELAHQLNDSGAETIIVLANFAHTLQQTLPNVKIKHVIITELGDLFSFFKANLVNFVVKRLKKLVPPYEIPGSITFTEMMKRSAALTFKRVILNHDNIAFLQYTGGTTGIAKGAILTHGNMVANVCQSITWMGMKLEVGKEVVVTPLPLYHIFSLTICALSFMKIGGMCVLITNPRDIPGFIKELSKIRYTVFVGINTLFNALMHNPEFAKLNFASLKLSISGGMSLQKAVADNWQKITGRVILEGYGLTETSPVITINSPDTQHFTGSIGLPIPSTDIMLRDEEGNEAAIGQEGELCVKGPQVMRGYWQQTAETKQSFTTDGWLKTGDVARMTEEGFFYIVDRKKDMILVSGFNVYPNEIEGVIASHPGVMEVAVVSVPNETTGEAVKAFIVKKDPNLTQEIISAYCRKNLTGYKVPRFIEFRDELPKSNVGKILRRKLRGV